MSIGKVFFVFLFMKVMSVRSVKQYCFVRKYAAVPVKLKIVSLQYTG